MKYLRSIKIITLVQIVSWILFILFDVYSEGDGYSRHNLLTNFFLILTVVLPIIISIIYLLIENRLCDKLQISKKFFNIIACITWILETSIIYIFIAILIDCHKWIVEPLSSFGPNLYGIQHFIFACALAILPILIISIVKAVKFIYVKMKLTP